MDSSRIDSDWRMVIGNWWLANKIGRMVSPLARQLEERKSHQSAPHRNFITKFDPMQHLASKWMTSSSFVTRQTTYRARSFPIVPVYDVLGDGGGNVSLSHSSTSSDFDSETEDASLNQLEAKILESERASSSQILFGASRLNMWLRSSRGSTTGKVG